MRSGGKTGRVFRKLHRWPGLIAAVFMLFFGLTGIVLNHRELFRRIDLPRAALPGSYGYGGWRNNALRGDIVVTPDSLLLFGDIGVWAADAAISSCEPLNRGLPGGADGHKVYDLHGDGEGRLYAATLFGLFAFDGNAGAWEMLPIEGGSSRFVALESVGDTLYAMSRSRIFSGEAAGTDTRFAGVELEAPAKRRETVSLFRVVMEIHSGGILGLPGRLLVDLLGLAAVFLSATGIVYFFLPGWIRRRKRRGAAAGGLTRIGRWSLAWHNRIGGWLFVLLALVYLTGMFLRPPLLALIARVRVPASGPVSLAGAGPWHDSLRDLRYDPGRGLFYISTSRGMYELPRGSSVPKRCEVQPPVSVMGITAFEPAGGGAYLVGSFSGLFRWDPGSEEIIEYPSGEAYAEAPGGMPAGERTVTGLVTLPGGGRWMIDYSEGAMPVEGEGEFPVPPAEIVRRSRISLWNLSLEVHTGRILRPLLGGLYILVVPLTGLLGIVVVISGYLMLRRRRRRA